MLAAVRKFLGKRGLSSVVGHYEQAGTELSKALLNILAEDGVDVSGQLTMEQLGGYDEFHTWGRNSTDTFFEGWFENVDFKREGVRVLDAGCGLGGVSRYVASKYNCHVVGVDLTPSFVVAAKELSKKTGLDSMNEFMVGSVTELSSLEDASFEAAYTIHVGMNIEDKLGFYSEMFRLLKPGGAFGIFDCVAAPGKPELLLPVPWASHPDENHLILPSEYEQIMRSVGFSISISEDVSWIFRAGREAGWKPPVVGGCIFGDNWPHIQNTMGKNISEGRYKLHKLVGVKTGSSL